AFNHPHERQGCKGSPAPRAYGSVRFGGEILADLPSALQIPERPLFDLVRTPSSHHVPSGAMSPQRWEHLMKREIESARHGGLRCSLIAGGVAALAMGVAATPAFADVIVQRTTTYGMPPAVTVETPAPAPQVLFEAPAPTITVTHPAAP